MKNHGAVLSGCLFVIAACGDSGGVPANTPMTMTPTAGMAAGGVSGSTSAAGASGSTGTAGSSTASGGSGGKAGGTGGGGGGPAPVTAIAHIMPLASATTGSAGSGGGGAAGSSGSAGSAGGSAAGGGITGTALFTKINIGVQLKIDVSGCTDGKTYPVHIHEGMSCDNAMTQGGHWGAVTAAAGSGGSSAGGSGGSSAGAGGHSAGAGGSSGGSSGAAGGAMPMMVRGEGIPDITCMGTMGSTALTRSTPDARIAWSIGDGTMTDVLGHVVVVHNANGDRIACGKIMMQ